MCIKSMYSVFIFIFQSKKLEVDNWLSIFGKEWKVWQLKQQISSQSPLDWAYKACYTTKVFRKMTVSVYA